MSKIIQKPRECRNAHCGAMCCPIQVEEMQIMWGGNPNKCPYYERRDDLYMDKAIPLDKVKQAREKIRKAIGAPICGEYIRRGHDMGLRESLEILDKLIESEEK